MTDRNAKHPTGPLPRRADGRLDLGCGCGHAWSEHNETGCFVKGGSYSCDDAYCFCQVVPEEIRAKQKAYRLGQVLCYPCKDHPRYQAKRKPTSKCEKCWRMWITVNP